MKEKILCVDDDPKILRGYSRQLQDKFDFETARGGHEGLMVMENKGPFCVIVSDMRMPEMDGIQFLSKVRECSPDSIRIILTGNADLRTAIDAVNKGSIFRFLTKPCSTEDLIQVLNAGIAQHQLVIAERVLLRDTLTGSVKVLTDLVSLLHPIAFSRASRVGRYAKHIATQLKIPDVWEFELAGKLSQIGCISLPAGMMDMLCKKELLASEDQRMLASHPIVARKLLENIPRMGTISEIIGRQDEQYWKHGNTKSVAEMTRIELGIRILSIALDLDNLMMRGLSFDDAWQKIAARSRVHNPEIIDALMDMQPNVGKKETREVCVNDVRVGMFAREDIVSKSGSLLVSKGHEITYPVLVLLRNTDRKVGVEEPIHVQVGGWIAETINAEPEAEVPVPEKLNVGADEEW